ncbi:metal ABC transporter permease [bacterium]|nr:MAG: metal ABC transporter permease [bacterium]QQR61572.1 MAG: metal ABC transporter permease [bacterium]QQR62892.1 MAG: metal ABC transporter permease [bacterium]
MVKKLLLVATATSLACSSVGFFLVLRGTVLVADAISHALVPGIVVAYLLTGSMHPVALLIGALVSGIGTVLFTELLSSFVDERKEVALALTFPLFFSVGVLLVNLYTSSLHLDIDMVLLGEILFASMHKLSIFGVDVGPQHFWVMLCIFLVNVLVSTVLFKPLQYLLFDKDSMLLPRHISRLLFLFLTFATGWTIMATLEVVGSLVTVCLMTVPAASVLLFSGSMKSAYLLTHALAGLVAVAGVLTGLWFDCSIAGSMALWAGLFFGGAYVASRGY